jgi:hypothetical protein
MGLIRAEARAAGEPCERAESARLPVDPSATAGVRGFLKVTFAVELDGQGIERAAVQIENNRCTIVTSGSTDDPGEFRTDLDAGHYVVLLDRRDQYVRSRIRVDSDRREFEFLLQEDGKSTIKIRPTISLLVLPYSGPGTGPTRLKATVKGGDLEPTGTVTFSNGSSVLGAASLINGVATLEVGKGLSRLNRITASFSGDENYCGHKIFSRACED